MCNFFSFISDGNGNIKYFDNKQRKQFLTDNPENYEMDSHSSIASYYFKQSNSDDNCNKYEFSNGTWINGNESLWNLTDSPGDGTWYYGVTSIEHSGVESRTLSNVFKIIINSGSGVGIENQTYPTNPKNKSNFYINKPSPITNSNLPSSTKPYLMF